MNHGQLKLWADHTDQEENDAQLLERAKALESFMGTSFKEVGLQAYFAGNLMTDFMTGMLFMATKVCKHMEFEDKEISQLFTEAYNIDLDHILKRYEYHPAVRDNPQKGLL